MKAAVVRPWPRDGIGFLLISTYVVWSYCTISRTDGIGGCSRLTMRPGWDDGGAALMNVPKLRVSLEMRWVGTQLCAGTSSLMVEWGWCGGVSVVCRCVCGIFGDYAFSPMDIVKKWPGVILPMT